MTTLSALAQSLRASMLGAAEEFDREPERGSLAQFQRLLQVALDDYSRRRPLIVLGRLQLEAERVVYDCPADLVAVQAFDWGRADKARLPVWADGWPGRLPDMRVSRDGDRRVLYLMPAPSARQIGLLGSAAAYRYRSRHTLDEQGSTIPAGDEPLVLLRAQAEAMRELAISHAVTPYQVRDGISATPRNGTPSYLHTVLMEEFERRICQ
ncbi:hypothetical protein ACFFU8_17765 [Chromobacterium piscinae]|uniref:hypothetical protein n=1 Tax=Chromobacterium piscinae TaxID=686831 RepID=UPI001E5FADAF|nr:hypothetical protein [Chromobacterium piscinae]MCD5329602.1 hypothetical protein [Chromobacterium piscinae]